MSEAAAPHDDEADTTDPRRLRSRDRLLNAATHLLTTGGIESVTVEAVTTLSKVARTTLYRNFGNSTELLAAAFERLLPRIDPPPAEGSLHARLTDLLARQAAAIQDAPMQLTVLAWLGMGPTAPPSAETPMVNSLRARVLEHYRQPLDDILDTELARAELGDVDRVFFFAQLLGPVAFMRLTGLRGVTRDDCDTIVRGVLLAAAYSNDEKTAL